MIHQNYNSYTQEQHNTWSTLFKRQVGHIHDKASKRFLQGLDRINFDHNYLPNFTLLNQQLQNLTGWQVQAVEGIVPYMEFFEYLAAKRFPSTTWIRDIAHLDYIEEPDIFHDVFGHVPLLTDERFSSFVCELARLALEKIDNPYSHALFSRLYWFTVEFGLIEEQGNVRSYGAGIASSYGESEFCLLTPHNATQMGKNNSIIHPKRRVMSIREMLEVTYSKDVYQTDYFVISDFEELFSLLPAIAALAEEELIRT